MVSVRGRKRVLYAAARIIARTGGLLTLPLALREGDRRRRGWTAGRSWPRTTNPRLTILSPALRSVSLALDSRPPDIGARKAA